MIHKFRDFYKKESINNKLDFFNKEKTGISFYNDILENPSYFRVNKGIVMELVYMTRDEYFKIISDWHDIPVSHQSRYIFSNNVKKIKENMLSGVLYNTPILDYRDKTQEGRHRIIAATELGMEKIPVYTIRYI